MLKTKKDIIKWLDKVLHNQEKVFITDRKYTINEDLTVDVEGAVDISNLELTKIPVQFRKVSGYFICDNNKLTSLKGSPSIVGLDFHCSNNLLETLQDGPQKVGGSYYCNSNQLTTLKGAPGRMSGMLDARNNKLTTLEHSPDFSDYEPIPFGIDACLLVSNNKLRTLDNLEDINGDIDYSNNPDLDFPEDLTTAELLVICEKRKLEELLSPKRIYKSFKI